MIQMTKNVRLIWIAVLGILAMGLFSCSDDDNKGYYFKQSFAVVQTDDDGYAQSFVLDNGEKLYVASSASSHKPESERVLIAYEELDEKKTDYDEVIHLLGYSNLLVKPAIYIPQDNEHLQDSVGHNEIKVFSTWASHNYISFKFGYNTANGNVHMLNLVSDNEHYEQQGDEPIKLGFRHKVVKGSELYASGVMPVSFDMSKYVDANIGKKEELIFEIKWEEYSGEVKTSTVKMTMPTAIVEPPVIEED